MKLTERMATFLDEKDELLSPQEIEEEKKWETEFQKRRKELEREKLKLEERKRQSCSRLEELNNRWRNIEQRRTSRSNMRRTATTLSSDETTAPVLPERGSTVL
ncbi:uncharacterized protein LOC143083267 [Mytilus galloprovincialis]|uniref:uncharacterized protein LOC143083267 n=1 Tax=Mytilus galloprovincialis TaxID=29158 RepID=UPI003F7BCE2A